MSCGNRILGSGIGSFFFGHPIKRAAARGVATGVQLSLSATPGTVSSIRIRKFTITFVPAAAISSVIRVHRQNVRVKSYALVVAGCAIIFRRE
jgi:hypothetical protein